jgi:hypothetical protein
MELTYVRIIRVRSTVLRTRSGRLSKSKAVPIPNGAWIEGTLIKPIRVGHEFAVRCTFFNGAGCLCGRVYTSSRVILIRRDYVFSENVQYKVMKVPEFDSERSLRAWD